MNLNEQLKILGFNDKKATLYCTLLKAQSLPAAELASLAGVKRTTAYSLLNELMEEGLAVVSFAHSKRVFTATPPENLQLRMQRQMAVLDETLPELNALYHRQPHKPRVRYYEGSEGVRRFHNELLQIGSGEYFYFGSMQGLIDVVGQPYLKSFVRKRVAKRIWSNAIRIREQEVDEPLILPGDENFRRARYISLPNNDKVVNMVLFEDKVAIISTSEENYVLIIESHELFAMMKTVWDYLWRATEK